MELKISLPCSQKLDTGAYPESFKFISHCDTHFSKAYFDGVGISQWYSAGLRAEQSGVRVPVGARNFSVHHRVQNGSGTHPASYTIWTRGSFPGGKAARAWNWPLTSI
jgi:hypothetical protein